MSTAAATSSNIANKVKPKNLCNACSERQATRLSVFSALCNPCCLANDLQYNVNDERIGLRIEKELFPEKNRGEKACTKCKSDNLVILYDEVDDEWLFCFNCKCFKQLLRCWNMYTNNMIDYLERPIIKPFDSFSGELDAIADESDESCSDLDTEEETASDVSSYLEEPPKDPEDIEYDAAGNLIFDDDLPPLERIIVEEDVVKPAATGDKKPVPKKKTTKDTKAKKGAKMPEEAPTRPSTGSSKPLPAGEGEMPDLVSASDTDSDTDSDGEAANEKKPKKKNRSDK